MMSPVSTFVRPRASRYLQATAAISNRSTARRANSWPRAMAARAGSPSTMCWPGFLFRGPDPLGPRRARTAAGAAPLRLRHDLAVSGLWRLHERAQFPSYHRHPALLRRARSRRQGRRARQLLLRKGAGTDVAGDTEYAAVHVR